jgi:tetraacyldisaccharide 4'-kinase
MPWNVTWKSRSSMARAVWATVGVCPSAPCAKPPRLDTVDAVVVNGAAPVGTMPRSAFTMRLQPGRFANLLDPGRQVDATEFQGRPVHAVAGIGHPERFFDTLRALGIDARAHPFPDHHPFQSTDLPLGTVVMTEKDAVKCADFGRDDLWSLGVDAQVGDGLQSLIIAKLKSHHGQQTD